MNRQPIYHKENNQFRVISVANGLWVAQNRTTAFEGIDTRIHDIWQSMHSPTTQDAAIAYMLMKCPLKQAA